MSRRGASAANTPAKIARADKMARALDLARQGYNLREIADALKISSTNAHELVSQGRRGIPEAARNALIAEIHERELALIRAHWDTRKSADSARVIQASDKLLMDLFGLAALPSMESAALRPIKIEIVPASSLPKVGLGEPVPEDSSDLMVEEPE